MNHEVKLLTHERLIQLKNIGNELMLRPATQLEHIDIFEAAGSAILELVAEVKRLRDA